VPNEIPGCDACPGRLPARAGCLCPEAGARGGEDARGTFTCVTCIRGACAGGHGRGFSVVAAEVREIANNVGLFSEQLQKELASQIDTLSARTQSMANAAMGTRLVDLALNAIEIIDRNLYERTCDVRWWATTAQWWIAPPNRRRSRSNMPRNALA